MSVDLTWGSPRSCTINNISELLVARWSGTQWESQGNAARTGTNSSGNITSTNVSAFTNDVIFTCIYGLIIYYFKKIRVCFLSKLTV